MARNLPALILLIAAARSSQAQLCAPAPGIELPPIYAEYQRENPDSHRFARAWTGRLPETPFTGGPGKLLAGGAVAGHFEVPLFLVRFADSGPAPYAPALLEDRLFDGPADQTMRGYYSEISAGLVDLDGTAYGWHQLPREAFYYSGTSYGTVPGNARLGELMRDTFQSYDAAIDFAQYDNDGPDGVPNSGDDDGYVDFVAFVQPSRGAECGGSANIWSHRWRYSAWPASSGSPYVTADRSVRGGPILIDDYTIQPALACDGTNPIEIGIFCHEFGHAFGLPDLYDVDGGGGAGLGHWCLMASGNWNQPSSPAHMSAWAKQKLGWVTTVRVDWAGTPLTIEPVVELPLVYELPLVEDRWARRSDCAIDGTASLSVGLDESQATARSWRKRGYGNGWRETIAHDFHYDGSGSVALSFDFSVDSETAFDFLFLSVAQNDVEQTIAAFSGRNAGRQNYDLSSKLVAGDYRVGFRFTSDRAYSTEDGNYPSQCFPAVLDDIALVGGGENHFADFESSVQGWYVPATQHDNPIGERWLVENRQAEGFDQHLAASGLLVYHVDDEVLGSILGNSGGSDNLHTRGVVIEEADGGADLTRQGGGRGNAGDVWPQSAATQFDLQSQPNSRGNSGTLSAARLESIAALGKEVTLFAWAGQDPPSLGGVTPVGIDARDGEQWLELTSADDVLHGAAVRLEAEGEPTVSAIEVEWTDKDRVRARFDFRRVQSADYDVVVVNPDGQSARVEAALAVDGDPNLPPLAPDAFVLYQNAPNPFNPTTTIRFDLPQDDHVRLTVLDLRGRRICELIDGTLPAGNYEERWDGRDHSGTPVASGLYFYRLDSRFGVEQRKMMLVR